jgi:hypothetical protein
LEPFYKTVTVALLFNANINRAPRDIVNLYHFPPKPIVPGKYALLSAESWIFLSGGGVVLLHLLANLTLGTVFEPV